MDLKEILDRSTANLKSKSREAVDFDWDDINYMVYYDAKNSRWTPIKEWAIKNNAMLEIEKEMDKILADEK